MTSRYLKLVGAVLGVMSLCTPAVADEATELAKKLANPIAALISAPLQVNYDENFGGDDEGSMWKTNIQPVVPLSIGENWNMISRTILPVIQQYDIPKADMDESGMGDIVQSIFFSPKEPTSGGLIWGVGPVFLFPTASDEMLGGEKWGIGPTAVMLKQLGPWTFGMLANHVESIAGEDERADISMSLIQPFVSFITARKTTIGINTESTYNWETDNWAIPINFTVMQLLKLGPQLVQVGGGIRYHADTTPGGPEELGGRFQVTFLFPK
ncbi:MAG: transporter [Thermodesulfobacteriota bacterium]